MACMIRFGRFLKTITVEPVMFLYMYLVFTQFLTFQALIYHKICIDNYNSSICEVLNKNKSLKTEDDFVQKQTSTWILYSNLAYAIPSIFSVMLFLGPWGDLVGRKIPLLLPVVGSLLNNISNMINAIYIHAQLGYLLIGSFINGLMGGFIGILMACHSYITHIAEPENRIVRIGILQAMTFLSSTIGTATSGVMLDRTGFVFVFSALIVIMCITLVYIVVWVDNIVPEDQELVARKGWFQSFVLDSVKNVGLCVYQNRTSKHFWNLLLVILIIFFIMITIVGENDIILVYTRRPPLSWSQTTLGLFKGTEQFLRGITLLILLPIFKRRFGMRDTTLVIIGLVSNAAGQLVLGLSSSTAVLFIGGVVGFMEGFGSSGLRSLCSNMVTVNEQAKVFSLVALFESISTLAATSLYNSIYNATLNLYHGFCFLMGSGILGLCLIIALFRDEFEGFNDWRRKKQRAPMLSSSDLKAHSTSLFSLVSMKFAAQWGTSNEDLEGLALSFSSYSEYLVSKNEDQQKRQMQNQPARCLSKHTYLEVREAAEEVKPKYTLLDNSLVKMHNYEHICFDEQFHLSVPFEDSTQKNRFFEGLRVSMPVTMLTYDPGSSLGKTVFLWKIPDACTTSKESNSRSIQIYEVIRDRLPEYHTRQMRKDFTTRYCGLNACHKIPKYILRSIYSELSLDATAQQNPALDARVQNALLADDPDLVLDMRHMNPGRPSETFTEFFDKLSSKVEELSAVDERRHGNVCHFSKYISVPDLITETAKELPENTPIPSESTVLFSFVPRNTHAKAAKLYTSRVPLQFKVQTRQLRVSHIDEHFCAAIFKYTREYAVQFREEVTFVCVDDKSKVDFGEPGLAVQTGVRGKKSIVPVGLTLSALDHDVQSKGSITPSVCLSVKVPDDISGSFYNGQVTVSYKDSVFEGSNPFRHAVEMEHILRQNELKPILILYSDGGPDHRLTYHSVKLALIILFKRLGLDTLIAARTAPGHSWLNPAERIMSVLNIGLQNVALMREESSSSMEGVLRTANSMSDIRTKAGKTEGLKDAWLTSVKPVKTILEERTALLSLKGRPFSILEAASEDEVRQLESDIQRCVDPNIVSSQYQQQQLKSKEAYQKFLQDHCRERHYTFQIRKCDVQTCCSPKMSQRADPFPWLPDPVTKPNDKDHYRPFNEVIGTDTTEQRPSAAAPTNKTVAEQFQGVRNDGLVAQNVRKIVKCFNCGKPRCVYSKKSLSMRDSRAFDRIMDKYDYSCGSLITPEGDVLQGVITVRLQMSCESHVEYAYYKSSLGKADICAHCAQDGADKDADLCQRFKFVLPVCQECVARKKEIPHRNPIH